MPFLQQDFQTKKTSFVTSRMLIGHSAPPQEHSCSLSDGKGTTSSPLGLTESLPFTSSSRSLVYKEEGPSKLLEKHETETSCLLKGALSPEHQGGRDTIRA